MGPAATYRDLIVWQRSHEFVKSIYRATASFPRDEQYGLTSQLRRAAVSIAANIAESFKKRGRLDKARILNIAQGSADECDYYLVLAGDLGYSVSAEETGLLQQVHRLLQRYTAAVLSNTKK